MMYWDVLDIEQTSDKRAIKRAYAKKLKLTRPDQDPEGFKQLRAAYESALSMADGLQYRDTGTSSTDLLNVEQQLVQEIKHEFDMADDISIERINFTESEVIGGEESLGSQSKYAEEQAQDDNYFGFDQAALYDRDALYALQVEQLSLVKKLFSEPDWERDEEKWEGIMCSPLMDDLYIKQEFTISVFNLAIKAIRRERIQKKPHLKPLLSVINELENVFNWKLQTELLQTGVIDHSDLELFDQYFNPEYVTSITSKYVSDKQHLGEMITVHGAARISVVFIDWFVFGVVCTIWNSVVDSQLSFDSAFRQNGISWFFLFYFFYFTVMEASPFQGSLGRIIAHQKVVTNTGRRLNIVHSFWRSIAFWIYIVTIKISVWFGLFIKDGRSVNDVMSGSRVIER